MSIVTKLKLYGILALLVLLGVAFMWWRIYYGGPSNAELQESIVAQSESVRASLATCTTQIVTKVDSRADGIEKRLVELASRLESIEGRLADAESDRAATDAKIDGVGEGISKLDEKLDRITRLLNPPLPDGLERSDAKAK